MPENQNIPRVWNNEFRLSELVESIDYNNIIYDNSIFNRYYFSYQINRPPRNTNTSENAMTEIQLTKMINAFVNDRRLSYYKATLQVLFPNMPQWLTDAINQNKSFREFEDEFRRIFPILNLKLQRCDHCGSYRTSDRSYRAMVDGEIEQWCYNCAERAYCWSDGFYRLEEEPRIGHYHDEDRDKLYDGVDFSRDGLLGLEIETYINGDIQRIVNVATKATKNFNVLAERDGSLDRTHGVEFIFRPYRLEEIVEGNELYNIVQYLRDNGTVGWDAGTGYGMHISINCNNMSDIHCGKFCTFINNNQELCERVGGRVGNMYSKYVQGYPIKTSSSDRVRDHDKYLSAVRRSSNRIEIRLFRSSLLFSRIRRNCEFVESVRIFTRDASINNLNSVAYLNWLTQNKEGKIYRNIKTFLGIVPNKEKKKVFVPRDQALLLETV